MRNAARAILQATLAATIAWLLATEIVGHATPFFAPVSAMITLGLTQGERGRRAVEVVLGVTLGIAVADLLVIELGSGWWQLALVVALAMTVALLLGSGQLFAQQAAVSAALVATLQPPDGGITFARAVDALIGGGVALAVSALVLPVHPGRMVREAAEPVLAELAGVLDDVAAALADARPRRRPGRAGARPRDRRARARARGRPDGRPRDRAAGPAAKAHAGHGRRLRRRRGARSTWRCATSACSPAARGARSTSTRTSRPSSPTRCASSPPRSARCAARSRTRAAPRPSASPPCAPRARATLVLERTGNLSVSVIVGQVRSTAVDLLRGTGMSYEEAADAVRAAVQEAEAEDFAPDP